MRFYLTERAYTEIENLTKKSSTRNVKEDICSFFIHLESIENIRHVDETLGLKGKNTTCKKSRVKNSINKEKSGGFRLYFIVSEHKEIIIIASIYSKKTTENYSKDEIKTVFKTANDAIQNGKLILVDVQKKLSTKGKNV
jgi:mRNA-degrading endonuclease RelE of RelBE toxin-antitoxin system